MILINQEDMVFSSDITTQKHTLCLFFGRIFMTMHANKRSIKMFALCFTNTLQKKKTVFQQNANIWIRMFGVNGCSIWMLWSAIHKTTVWMSFACFTHEAITISKAFASSGKLWLQFSDVQIFWSWSICNSSHEFSSWTHLFCLANQTSQSVQRSNDDKSPQGLKDS